jgi:hypothetical protein
VNASRHAPRSNASRPRSSALTMESEDERLVGTERACITENYVTDRALVASFTARTTCSKSLASPTTS